MIALNSLADAAFENAGQLLLCVLKIVLAVCMLRASWHLATDSLNRLFKRPKRRKR